MWLSKGVFMVKIPIKGSGEMFTSLKASQKQDKINERKN